MNMLGSVLLLSLLLAGCTSGNVLGTVETETGSTAASDQAKTENGNPAALAGTIRSALERAGVATTTPEPLLDPVLFGEGVSFSVQNANVRMLAFPSAAELQAAAARIQTTPDGGTPVLFRRNGMLLIYDGNEPITISVLEQAFGERLR
ncbi:MAG: hypothetical protein PHW10_00940 [Candidatus Peribacteraceae bacterium]|nr:hypothetical protein [Candidatus Peribacteraceae bacterium]